MGFQKIGSAWRRIGRAAKQTVNVFSNVEKISQSQQTILTNSTAVEEKVNGLQSEMKALQVGLRLLQEESRQSVEGLKEQVKQAEAGLQETFKVMLKGPVPVQPVPFYRLDGLCGECYICGSESVRWASAYPSNEVRFRGGTILCCENCGTSYVPDAEQLINGYYATEYANKNRGDRQLEPEKYFSGQGEKAFPTYFRRANEQIEKLLSVEAKFDCVLDYGSGPGYFLYASGAAQKFAVELDDASNKYLDYLGATKLDPEDLPRSKFDVIVASHVVEHLCHNDVLGKVESLIDALKADGVLLIEVPQGGFSYVNMNSHQDPHTLFFTPYGLEKLVVRAGGEIVEKYSRCGPIWKPRTDPIYTPDETDPFYSATGEGLTVICRRKNERAEG